MKEASGELSMTAIAVVAIGAIAVLFTTLIWPNIQRNIERNANCSQSCGCVLRSGSTDTYDCKYMDSNDTEQNVVCVMD